MLLSTKTSRRFTSGAIKLPATIIHVTLLDHEWRWSDGCCVDEVSGPLTAESVTRESYEPESDDHPTRLSKSKWLLF